jgi:hypothetical protein
LRPHSIARDPRATPTTRDSPPGDGGESAGARLFGIDYRALRLFRAGLALLLLGDLCARWGDIGAFYTDLGVLPRSLLQIPRLRLSLHAMVDGRRADEVLFLVAASFALLLLFGVGSRFAALVSWFLLASLDARNPLVLNHGDELLKILLFWSIFVPLSPPGAARGRRLSIFTAALTLQVCIVYFFGALLKTDAAWRFSGTAIYSALSLEQLSTGFGRELLNWPGLLRAATFFVYYLELVGPVLLFVPWGNRRIREAAIVLFVAVHLGIAATMSLGLFPWVSILGWVLLLPSETLDSLQRVIGLGPAEPRHAAIVAAKGGVAADVAVQMLGAYLLSAVLIWNLRTLNLKTGEVVPTPFDAPLLLAQLDQRWNMFAPFPNYVSGWVAARADLADGRQVDLLNSGRPFSWERPEPVSETYPDFRWRKYLTNMGRPQFERYRQALPAYLRRQWDGAHPAAMGVRRLTVYLVWQNKSLGDNPPVVTSVIGGD